MTGSPFPGMDPWLERHWGDVHTRMLTYASDRLQSVLPRDLRARVEERVQLEFEEKDGSSRGRTIVPDARVVEYPHPGPQHADTAGVALLAPTEPLIVTERDEPAIERFVEIRDFSTGGRLVTVIEVLSPGNKQRGMPRELYRQKRGELREARVHLVEIDLLRGGQPVEPVLRTSLTAEHHTPYLITVTREEPGIINGRRYEIYKVPLRERLPVISVPLRPTDADALLDVQAVLNDAYTRGGYDIIDYNTALEPPLSNDDDAWTGELLRSAGRV